MDGRIPLHSRRAAVVCAVLFALHADPRAQQPASPDSFPAHDAAAQERSIAGRLSVSVIAADTAAPVKYARVAVEMLVLPPRAGAGSSSVRLEKQAETDARGRVEFTALPSTLYRVTVVPPAPFVGLRGAPAVEVKDGESTSLVIRVERTGAITGRLVDVAGDPLPSAWVIAIGRATPNRLDPATLYGASDESGQFRLQDVPPGDYLILAAPRNDSPRPQAGTATDARLGFVPTYYPGMAAIGEARAVTVQGGHDTTGVDFPLLRGTLARVIGTAVDSAGVPLDRRSRADVILTLRRGEQSVLTRRARRLSDGAFAIENVPPGSYILGAFCDGSTAEREGFFLPITVSGEDVKVAVRTNTGAGLAGHVTIEGGPSPSSPAAQAASSGDALADVRLSARLAGTSVARAAFSTGETVSVAWDGAFQMRGVRGPIFLTASNGGHSSTPLTPIAVLKSIRRGADEMTGRSLDLIGTENVDDIEIALTTDTGMLTALVTDAEGKPAAGAWVVIFNEDPKWWYLGSSLVRGAYALLGTSRTPIPTVPGQVIFPHLLPGRYHVVVFGKADDYAGLDPSQFDGEALSMLRQRATSATVVGGRATMVSLRRE